MRGTGLDRCDPAAADHRRREPKSSRNCSTRSTRCTADAGCASSSPARAPRKPLRGGGNLLGGGAVRRELYPLVSAELDDFSLERARSHGLLPPHYLSGEPALLISAYVGDYLREEVLAEALSRNLPTFQRFLEVAALSNGQIVNYTSIAREVSVAANTMRSWFEVLIDTLIGVWLPA